MRTPRFFVVATLAVLLSALVGGFVGSSAQATQDQVSVQYRVFTSALAAIDREYVEPLASDRLIYDAVGGMLQTLDPHSSFFDPKQYAQMQERQEGKYYGIGLSILTIDGDVTVMTLFEGSPAYRAGIRRGDIIAVVKGVDAKNWTTEQTAKELKGNKGTNAKDWRGRSQSYYLYRNIMNCDTITRPDPIYHFPFMVGRFLFRKANCKGQ